MMSLLTARPSVNGREESLRVTGSSTERRTLAYAAAKSAWKCPIRKPKPSKVAKSPETVASPNGATGQDVNVPVCEAGKKARVAKQKLPNGRHGRQSKKRLTEASVPPVQRETGVETGGAGDRGFADPVPSAVERPAPSPGKADSK